MERKLHWTQQQLHPVSREYVSLDIKMLAGKKVEVAWVSFSEELTFEI